MWSDYLHFLIAAMKSSPNKWGLRIGKKVRILKTSAWLISFISCPAICFGWLRFGRSFGDWDIAFLRDSQNGVRSN